MDDYYGYDDMDLSPADRERRGHRRRILGSILILLGLAAAAAAGYLIWQNYREDAIAGQAADAILEEMQSVYGVGVKTDAAAADAQNLSTGVMTELMADGSQAGITPLWETNPDMAMPTVEINGNEYCGILRIPAIDRTLPVMNTWSYAGLKLAPTRYIGTPYAKDMVICAHNYERHFGLIKTLKPGDAVSFTDTFGNEFNYEVSEVITLKPTDVEAMQDPMDWDLTLFTCTLGGAERVTVRCVMTGYRTAESKSTDNIAAQIAGIKDEA